MMPWSAATAPTCTLTRTNRAPVAAATASADRTSFFSTLTPMGSETRRRISPIATAIPATVAASTRPAVNGTSPWFSTTRASTPPSARACASSSAARTTAAMSPSQRGLPGSARRCTMPMTARVTWAGRPMIAARLIGRDDIISSMVKTPGGPPARIFYGYWVVLALAVIVFLSTGIRFTIGPFLKPVAAELSIDRGTFSLVISLSLFLYGAFMPLVGRLVDRLGSRAVCSAGAVLTAISLVLTGRMTSLWEFYLYYAVVGSLGVAATGHVMGSVALARWFVRRRGLAMSALGAAGMAGMAVLVPVAMWCILRYGWRASFVILGLGSLVIMLPLTLWVLR